MMSKSYLLGYDIGSSSIKASLINADTGDLVGSAYSPGTEMKIDAPQIGWAEQNPEDWWNHVLITTNKIIPKIKDVNYKIEGIGISYQMHGLVVVDKNHKVLHPSIIWCDSRAVEIGDSAFDNLGKEYCLGNCLNSPGNFTASKLKWVKDNLPALYDKIYKIMLPGDYIASRLSGEINTTISGLSEGVFWDFKENDISEKIINHYDLSKDLIADIVPTFGVQGKLTKSSAKELGIEPGIPIAYRAGDQPNNAFSLNVLNPGEVAATAGTSGVVYGIAEKNAYDNKSRVNLFAHVNYTKDNPLKGVLLCLNGTGILYNWLKNEVMGGLDSYENLNKIAADIHIGSDDLIVLPFGNGAERILENRDIKSHLMGISFNKHSRGHLIRAAQEGIVFSFKYGIDIMNEIGIDVNVVRVGDTNLFLSSIFREAFANVCNLTIEIYNTDGAQGAARGAGIGVGLYPTVKDAFEGFKKLDVVEPDADLSEQYNDAYQIWKMNLDAILREE
jgi:xylulokinase